MKSIWMTLRQIQKHQENMKLIFFKTQLANIYHGPHYGIIKITSQDSSLALLIPTL